jgi:hypothetical protein
MSGARIGKMFRLLSSDQPGEVAAAAGAFNRALKSAGIDIHALAAAVESAVDAPLVPRQPTAKRPTYPAKANKPRAFHPGVPFQMGASVICDAADGLFSKCRRCGSTTFTVMAGIGPHVAQLRCDGCRTGGRWLSRAHFGATP